MPYPKKTTETEEEKKKREAELEVMRIFARLGGRTVNGQ
jgi:hypothetical protein